MQAQDIRTKLNMVPVNIRTWLGSEGVLDSIEKINHQFHITGESEKIIPRLLLRLQIKDLEPQYFAGELSVELKIDRDKAKTITEEMRRRVLIPVQADFAGYGVQLQQLDSFEIPVAGMRKQEPQAQPTSALPISSSPASGGIPVFRSPVASAGVPASKPAAQETAKPGAGPVFLHRESLFEPIKQKVEFKLEFPGEEKSATRDIHPAPHSPSPLAWLKNAAPAPGGKIMIKTPPSGQTQNPLPPSFGKTDTTPKVVHYNEGKSAIESLRPAPKPAGVPIADLNAPKDKPAFTPITPLIKKDEIHPAAVPQKAPFPPANLPPMSSSPKPMAPPAKPVSFVPPPPPPLIKSAMLPRPIAPPSPFNTKAPVPPPPPKPGFTPGPKRIDLTSL